MAVVPVGVLLAVAGSAPGARVEGCPDLSASRLRSPERFVKGLAGAWVPVEAHHCLYMVPTRMSAPTPIFRSPLGGALRGPVWSPTRPELAVAHRAGTGFEVALLDTNGRLLRRFLGRDATFFRDGRMLVRRGDSLRLVGGGRKLTIPHTRLERAAGFPVTGFDLSATDGYGRAGVLVAVWGERRSRLLLVSGAATLTRVSPVYRAQVEGELMPGPAAWSPDGRILLIPWQRDDPANAASHVHCLARWTPARGYRVTVCRNPHFHRILWHPDGGTALLNNGLIVARDGTVRARIRLRGRGMSVRWKQPLLEAVG